MQIDREYCSSSYLMYRTIANHDKCFSLKYKPNLFKQNFISEPVNNSMDLGRLLKSYVENAAADGKAALMLSGGIDSAILASYMPKGSVAYTLQCIVPGIEVIDETIKAAQYAKKYGLQHRIIKVYWEDFQKEMNKLMLHKGAPIHSIEVQIYKAAKQAKTDGFNKLIFGDSADLKYGGLTSLLSKDWTFGEFTDRYPYVIPYKVLKNFKIDLQPFKTCEENGYIDTFKFMRTFFYNEAMGSYHNACEVADIKCITPYAYTQLNKPLDLLKIRSGCGKYIIRELFNERYPGFDIPKKTPMPRPMNEWLKDWEGPVRREFWPHCTDKMSGDQKWLVYCLERWLEYLDKIDC
ncbi:MAG: asparagine synthase-related protein [Clostridiaceae bacterium]|nr:asparagine synthase-related protein [Clostridiaceae bacterium]